MSDTIETTAARDDTKTKMPTKLERLRCKTCNAKIMITNAHKCRCDGNFCQQHFFFSKHACPYDYKLLREKLVKVVPDKIQSI